MLFVLRNRRLAALLLILLTVLIGILILLGIVAHFDLLHLIRGAGPNGGGCYTGC